jgi:hypothetical protein
MRRSGCCTVSWWSRVRHLLWISSISILSDVWISCVLTCSTSLFLAHLLFALFCGGTGEYTNESTLDSDRLEEITQVAELQPTITAQQALSLRSCLLTEKVTKAHWTMQQNSAVLHAEWISGASVVDLSRRHDYAGESLLCFGSWNSILLQPGNSPFRLLCFRRGGGGGWRSGPITPLLRLL